MPLSTITFLLILLIVSVYVGKITPKHKTKTLTYVTRILVTVFLLTMGLTLYAQTALVFKLFSLLIMFVSFIVLSILYSLRETK